MFEHSLIDLETAKQPRSRRWISLPIAIALHVVGLTAFAFASYWTVGSVTEPDMIVAFVQLAPLPEMPAGGGGGGVRTPVKPVETEVKPIKPAEIVQPTDKTVPEDVPPPATTNTETTDVDDFTSTGETGDGPIGDPNLPIGPGFGPGKGGPGVNPNGDGDGPVAGEGESQPIRFTVGMTKPEPIRQIQPRYTENARRAGVQGAVILEAIIDEQGNVTDVRVLRGLPMGLDREAVSAVQQWKFRPAMMASKPVKVYFNLTVNFTIQR
jgi:periplasmic protein TonB